MKVPVILRIAALVFATTAFYTYVGQMHWGRVSRLSQYVLVFVAISFTWLMGLMGYVRSGLRQHWHVYGVMRDQSLDAFTPTLGFATQIISVIVIIFFTFIAFVFWLSSLHDKPDYDRSGKGLAAGAPAEHGRLS